MIVIILSFLKKVYIYLLVHIFLFCYAIAIVLTVWVIASFINVNMHNMSDGAYAVWNLFTLLF